MTGVAAAGASGSLLAVQLWLPAHVLLHLHFAPTGSSWLNLVERWFAEVNSEKLRRQIHRSVQAHGAVKIFVRS